MSNARKAVSPGRAMAILSCIRLIMLSLALLAAPFAFADDMELPAQLGLFAAGLVAAWFTWRTYKRARDAEIDRDFVPVTERPEDEQRAIYKRSLIATGLGCGVLSGMAWWEISTAAPGERITMWAPLAMMYDVAGPWGAILTPVAIWIALALTVMKRQYALRQAERSAA